MCDCESFVAVFCDRYLAHLPGGSERVVSVLYPMGSDTSIVVLNLVRMTPPAHRAFSRAGHTGIGRSRNYADHRRRSVSV